VNGFCMVALGTERAAGVAVEPNVRGAAGVLAGGLFQTAAEEGRVLGAVAGALRVTEGTRVEDADAAPAAEGALTAVDLWPTAGFGTERGSLGVDAAVLRTVDGTSVEVPAAVELLGTTAEVGLCERTAEFGTASGGAGDALDVPGRPIVLP